jgi:16S rRNA processing protein RimM
MNSDTFITIGRITGVHGIKGYVKIHCEADMFEVMAPGLTLKVRLPNGTDRFMEIMDARPQGRTILLQFKGIPDRTEAENLSRSELLIDKSLLPELDADTYYWTDICGLSVVSTDGISIGTIVSLIETGSNDVYVVKTPDNDEILIPAIASVIQEIDLNRRVMRVDIPEGL